MEEWEYPKRFEVHDDTSDVVISYEDPSPESGTILMQKRHVETEVLLEEELLSKGDISLGEIIESWEARVATDDHQGERPPFTADSITPDDRELELAQAVHTAAVHLDTLVEQMEEYLEQAYQPDLSEARYDLRKAAEYAMCAAHRTKELAHA